MKKNSIYLCVILTTMLSFFLVACGDTDETSDDTTKAAPEKIYYSDDDTINEFIVNYNNANPDDAISEDMIEKDEHHGTVHDDQVNIIKYEDFEVNISGGYTPAKVFLDGETVSLDDYKDMFIKYAKGLAPKLSSEKLENYWDQILNEQSEYGGNVTMDFDEFECMIYANDDHFQYMTIEGVFQ